MSSLFDDIIVGISTGYSEGAISIVRLSGKGSINLVSKLFKGHNLNNVESHTIHYGYIINKDNILDEVLVSIFKAPKTYTKEDVVEINCHGGIFITNQIYELLVLNGARPAEPGEFTKRAYLNGRIDLTKAEAVMDMIEAESLSATALASKALQGDIKLKIDSLREKILNVISKIEVNIDYPEYDDVEELKNNDCMPIVIDVNNELDELIKNSFSAKYLKNGIDTAIIGSPNVGKSSILNALTNSNKAIVTSIPGTTRDTIEAKINLDGITLNLIDTAGIRVSNDLVEQLGVEKSLDMINKAELILYVIDGSTKFNDDLKLLDQVKLKKHLFIINKKDLGITLNKDMFDNYIEICSNNVEDISILKDKIASLIKVEHLENKDITYISSARQIEKLNKASLAVKEALNRLNDNTFIDLVEISLREAWMYLGEITGEVSTDDLVSELFKRFCLGK